MLSHHCQAEKTLCLWLPIDNDFSALYWFLINSGMGKKIGNNDRKEWIRNHGKLANSSTLESNYANTRFSDNHAIALALFE